MWDWICLSPKKQQPPVGDIYTKADELKVIIECHDDFFWAEENRKLVGDKCHLYLQPEWKSSTIMIPEIVEYVKKNFEWRISIQAHKYMHIP
jgi:7-carboxy-7-deazaguanine synthase